LSAYARKLSGKIGVFERRLQKNVSIIIDGAPWRIPPTLIGEYRKGNKTNLPVAKSLVVECDATGLQFCSPGDTVLMYRGIFDVVNIVSINPLRCKVLSGRSKGKAYCYKPDMFVQKLDSSKFG